MMRATIARVGGAVPGGDAAGRQVLDRRDGLLLTLSNEDLVVGVGEASPLPGYGDDTLARADAALAAWRPPPLQHDESLRVLLERATDGMDSAAARFAVETALLDCLGRRRGLPVHRLLGAADGPRHVAVSHLIPVAGAAACAAALRERGVRHLKLKIGTDPEAENRAIHAVRSAVADAEIRLDANGRLPPADVPALFREYAKAAVALVEEPCAAGALMGLPRLTVPVALDESLARPDAASLAATVARTQPLVAVVLKPTLLGGVGRCLELAAVGRALGAHPIVTHTFDGPVAMAAAAELALALPDARVAGLGPHAYLDAYPRWRGAALGETVASHDTPGLGMREIA